MRFDLIPMEELEIDQPGFKASKWRMTLINGELHEMSTCYEWIGGKWEGFVSIRKFGSRNNKKKSNPWLLCAA